MILGSVLRLVYLRYGDAVRRCKYFFLNVGYIY